MGANYSATLNSSINNSVKKVLNKSVTDINNTQTTEASSKVDVQMTMEGAELHGACKININANNKLNQSVDTLLKVKIENDTTNEINDKIKSQLKTDVQQQNKDYGIGINADLTVNNVMNNINSTTSTTYDNTIKNMGIARATGDTVSKINLKNLKCYDTAELTINQNTVVDQVYHQITDTILENIGNNKLVTDVSNTIVTKKSQTNEGSILGLIIIGIIIVSIGGGGAGGFGTMQQGPPNPIVTFILVLLCITLIVFSILCFTTTNVVDKKFKCCDGKNTAIIKDKIYKTLKNASGNTLTPPSCCNVNQVCCSKDDINDSTRQYYEYNRKLINDVNSWKCLSCNGDGTDSSETPTVEESSSILTKIKTMSYHILGIICAIIAGILFLVILFRMFKKSGHIDSGHHTQLINKVKDKFGSQKSNYSPGEDTHELGGGGKKNNTIMLIILLILLFICMN